MSDEDDFRKMLVRMARTNRLVEAVRECRLDETVKRQGLRDVIRRLRHENVSISVGCDGDCCWNGVSRRCSCDNRRMYWNWSETTHWWHPEAY